MNRENRGKWGPGMGKGIQNGAATDDRQLTKFRVLLCKADDLENRQDWKFRITNLPVPARRTVTDTKVWVKSVTFNDEGVTLSFTKQSVNRVLVDDDERKFIHLSFHNFRLPNSSQKATAAFIAEFLKRGLALNGSIYNFYGHSNSQLKSKSCFLYAASTAEIERKIARLGNFSSLKSPAKRAKRIGLLFSSSEATLQLNEEDTEDIDDIQDNGCNFSDGCGLISKQFAIEIASKSRIAFGNNKYAPSVFQIRYKGYKGVLMMNPSLVKKVQFRASMKKFNGSPSSLLGVLEYSSPFTYGFLNGEIVTLLSSLGIPDETFIHLQNKFLERLKKALVDPQTAFLMLCAKENYEAAKKLVLEGCTDKVMKEVRDLVKGELSHCYKTKHGGEEEKVRIWVEDSRILLGVCDYTGTLNEGECHVRITRESGGPLTLDGAEVVVTRNPCLHPGDIRKFKAVKNPNLDHLVDCVVFPTKGTRDPASLMSGGDLDGDKFFVCWEKSLIPEVQSEPYSYPPAKEVIKRDMTQNGMIQYFANFNNASLGKVKNLYLKWLVVTEEGANSPQCQELNKLFSSAVDGEYIKVPEQLENLPERRPNQKPFILEQLINNFRKKRPEIDKVLTEARHGFNGSEESEDFLTFLLQSESLPAMMDEYELFQMVLEQARAKGKSLSKFLPHFNFNSFTIIQKHAVLAILQEEDKFSSETLSNKWIGPLFNALHYSSVLSGCQKSLEEFHLLNPKLRWQLLYSSWDDNGKSLYENLSRGMQEFANKLIVFSPRDDLRTIMYIPGRMEKGQDENKRLKPLKLFCFDQDAGTAYNSTTGPTYKVAFDGEILQIYEKKKSNSFIWFALNENFRVRNATVEKCNFKTSIALNKFDKRLGNKRRLQKGLGDEIEIYVISNRDREGCQILDILDRQVDTKRIMNNVQNMPKEYQLPNWLEEGVLDGDHKGVFERFLQGPPTVSLVDVQNRIKTCSETEKANILRTCLYMERSFGWEERTGMFSNVFEAIMEGGMEFISNNLALCQSCMEALPKLVVMIIRFVGSIKENHEFVKCLYAIIKALLFASTELEGLTVELFKKVISDYRPADFAELTDLIKLISYSVREPEVAKQLVKLFFKENDSDDLDLKYGKGFAHALILNYIDEVCEACPCDQKGIPFGAEDLISDVSLSNQIGSWAERKPKLSEFLFPDQKQKPKNVKNVDPIQKNLEISSTDDNPSIFVTIMRTDIPCKVQIQNEDHIRFVASRRPEGLQNCSLASFDAIVTRSNQGKIEFSICQKPVPLQLETASWNLYFCGKTTNLNTELNAIKILMDKKSMATTAYSAILGKDDKAAEEKQSKDLLPVNQIEAGKFNENQLKAIKTAVSTPTTLIWGPPGTGKTTVVVEIIKQFYATNKRILVTASTNKAVDNVMERFLEEAKKLNLLSDESHAIRLASGLDKVSKDLQRWTMDAFVGADIHSNDKAKREARKKFEQAMILFTTCSGAGVGLLREGSTSASPFGLNCGEKEKEKKKRTPPIFDVVIVDEASQLTEPNCLVPLVKWSKFVVLVGDHVQLTPLVKSESAKELNLQVSLFQRLYEEAEMGVKKNNLEQVMLDYQYRTSSDLIAFPSKMFYKNKLVTNAETDEKRKIKWPFWKWKKPTIFINCTCPESKGSSKYNEGQLKYTAQICKFLYANNDPNGFKDVVVLTPYAEHAKRTKELLKDGFGKVEVNTIDGFQGREADIIIFATVRSNPHGDLGFVEDKRRINVAVTRARYALIILGDEATLKTNRVTREMIQGESCERVDIGEFSEGGKGKGKKKM